MDMKISKQLTKIKMLLCSQLKPLVVYLLRD